MSEGLQMYVSGEARLCTLVVDVAFVVVFGSAIILKQVYAGFMSKYLIQIGILPSFDKNSKILLRLGILFSSD